MIKNIVDEMLRLNKLHKCSYSTCDVSQVRVCAVKTLARGSLFPATETEKLKCEKEVSCTSPE